MNGLLILLQLVAAPQAATATPPAYGAGTLPRVVCGARSNEPRCRRPGIGFRLLPQSKPVDDPVARSMRENWSRCGLSGMPVCPAKGRLILRAELVND